MCWLTGPEPSWAKPHPLLHGLSSALPTGTSAAGAGHPTAVAVATAAVGVACYAEAGVSYSVAVCEACSVGVIAASLGGAGGAGFQLAPYAGWVESQRSLCTSWGPGCPHTVAAAGGGRKREQKSFMHS